MVYVIEKDYEYIIGKENGIVYVKITADKLTKKVRMEIEESIGEWLQMSMKKVK